MPTFRCRACRALVRPNAATCKACGSPDREIGTEDTAVLRAILRLKGRRGLAGRMKVYIEKKLGDEFYRLLGKWRRIHRTFDHNNDEYREVITDAETGQVVVGKYERLSEHQGRGSAKHRGK